MSLDRLLVEVVRWYASACVILLALWQTAEFCAQTAAPLIGRWYAGPVCGELKV